jgi:hypothetical protein
VLVLARLRLVLAGNYTVCDGKSGTDDDDDNGAELALSLFCVGVECVLDGVGRV